MTLRRVVLALAGAASAPGCLALPEGTPAPMCVENADCNVAAGEICDENICWGDPPTTSVAVLAGAPIDRPDLTTSEIVGATIAPSGWFSAGLEHPVMLSGRVTAACASEGGSTTGACEPGASIDASVVVTRTSRIPGGPSFRVVVPSVGGLLAGPSFTVAVPRSNPGEVYTVVAYPNRDPAQPGSVAPPERRQLELSGDVADCDFLVGAPQLRELVGSVAGDTAELGTLAGFRVYARGRWTATTGIEDLSTVAYTDDTGRFTLRLPAGLGSTEVDLIAEPPAGRSLPTLQRLGVPLGGAGTTETPTLIMPPLGAAHPVQVRAVGADGVNLVDVSGAEITVITTFRTAVAPQALTGAPAAIDSSMDTAVMIQTATSNGRGLASFDILPGTDPGLVSYQVRVRPPSATGASSFGAVWGVSRDLASASVVAIELPPRVAISGRVVDASGAPTAGVVVAASPSASFIKSLPDDLRAVIATIGTGDQVTDADGNFTTWVDGTVEGEVATYDLRLVPQAGALLPRSAVNEITVGATGEVTLGEVRLPEAAYVRAVVGESGAPEALPVPGADVRLFQPAVCVDNVCDGNATELAAGVADEAGVVRFVLPRP